MKTIEELGLRFIAESILEALIENLHGDPYDKYGSPVLVNINDIVKSTGIKRMAIKDSLPQLVEKGIINVYGESVYNTEDFIQISLDKNYWYLHPDWKNIEEKKVNNDIETLKIKIQNLKKEIEDKNFELKLFQAQTTEITIQLRDCTERLKHLNTQLDLRK